MVWILTDYTDGTQELVACAFTYETIKKSLNILLELDKMVQEHHKYRILFVKESENGYPSYFKEEHHKS